MGQAALARRSKSTFSGEVQIAVPPLRRTRKIQSSSARSQPRESGANCSTPVSPAVQLLVGGCSRCS